MILKFPEQNYGVQFIGPTMPFYEVVLHGYSVPRLKCQLSDDKKTGSLILDDRFVVKASVEEIQRWVYLIANALAIGAGFSCHGENSQVSNPFKCQVHVLSDPL